jgi:hypothetical protein
MPDDGVLVVDGDQLDLVLDVARHVVRGTVDIDGQGCEPETWGSEPDTWGSSELWVTASDRTTSLSTSAPITCAAPGEAGRFELVVSPRTYDFVVASINSWAGPPLGAIAAEAIAVEADIPELPLRVRTEEVHGRVLLPGAPGAVCPGWPGEPATVTFKTEPRYDREVTADVTCAADGELRFTARVQHRSYPVYVELPAALGPPIVAPEAVIVTGDTPEIILDGRDRRAARVTVTVNGEARPCGAGRDSPADAWGVLHFVYAGELVQHDVTIPCGPASGPASVDVVLPTGDWQMWVIGDGDPFPLGGWLEPSWPARR